MIYSVAGPRQGWTARAAVAEARRDKIKDDYTDPEKVAARRWRMDLTSRSNMNTQAERNFISQNKPVACPLTGTFSAMHPDLARRLKDWATEHGLLGRDPRAPIDPPRTQAEILLELMSEAGLEPELRSYEDYLADAYREVGVDPDASE